MKIVDSSSLFKRRREIQFRTSLTVGPWVQPKVLRGQEGTHGGLEFSITLS